MVPGICSLNCYSNNHVGTPGRNRSTGGISVQWCTFERIQNMSKIKKKTNIELHDICNYSITILKVPTL